MRRPSAHRRHPSASIDLSPNILVLATLLISCTIIGRLQITADAAHEDSSSSALGPFHMLGFEEGPEVDIDGFTIDEHLSDSIEDEIDSRHEKLKEDEIAREESADPESKKKHLFQRVCPDGFFTCANGECLSPKWRCDGHYDCDDFSDELNCTNLLIGPSSPQPIQLAKQKPKQSEAQHQPQTRQETPRDQVIHSPHHEEEVNEIKFNSSQEPMMLFSNGGYIRGYWMSSRIYFDVTSKGGKPARSESPPSITQALSIFFGIQPLERSSAPSRPDSAAGKPRSTIVGLDMDPHDKEVFWVELGKDPGVFSTTFGSDFEFRSRRQLSSRGPRYRTVVDSGLLSPEDIALDTVGKNLYITDAGLPAIVVCSIKFSHCRTIVKEGLHKPRAIIVDSATGWLTYTDWGDHPGIFLVSMDGKRRETLIDTDVVWPNGLTADYQTNQLYWADARLSKIERIDLSTRKRREVIKETGANPFSLSLFENRIYWSDWSGSAIKSCDKYSGNSSKVLMHSDDIYGIHIYHPSIYGKLTEQINPCWSKVCSHMCLIAPSVSSSSFAERKSGSVTGACACPDSMALSIGDAATCYEVQLSFLIINAKDYIAQLFPDRIGLNMVERVIYSRDHVIRDVAADWAHYRLFFFDSAKQHIYSVSLADRSAEIDQFMPAPATLRSLLYDSWSDNLYWLDAEHGTLSMCPVKGKFEIVLRRSLDRPMSMILDSRNRVLYVAVHGASPHIFRTDIFADEQTDLMIVHGDISQPIALHLDEQKQRLYWADQRRESIESIDLDVRSDSGIKSDSRIVHRRRMGSILAFIVHHDSFLWTIKNGDYIYKAKIADHEQTTPAAVAKIEETRPVSFKLPPNPFFKASSTDEEHKRIILVDPRRGIVNSPCPKRSCSHGCVYDTNHNAVCICPEGFKLQLSNKTNCVPFSYRECTLNLIKCPDNSHCIHSSSKCDGKHDCDDGWDESDCHLVKKAELIHEHPTVQTVSTSSISPPIPAAATATAAASAAMLTSSTEPLSPEAQSGNRMVWLILLLLLLSVTGLVTLVSLLILYRQGRLPRQVSQLSVSFIHQNKDRDGAMLLLDNDN